MRQRIRLYELTPAGKDCFREVEEHMKDHGYTTFKEVQTYFKISDSNGVFNPNIIALRGKLDKIEESRGMKRKKQ
jgi:hypothetical protein